MNTKDISIEDLRLKVLVYGKSGTGKTTFACSFPKPYVFDFDNGMLSQRGKRAKQQLTCIAMRCYCTHMSQEVRKYLAGSLHLRM